MDDLPLVMSFDPGTNHLGIAVMALTPETGHLKLLHVWTTDISRLAESRYPGLIAYHGVRMAKLKTIHDVIEKAIESWRPTYVVSESPYMGRFPQAYGALMECLLTIRNVILAWDYGITLHVIDPASVKQAVGVSGRSGDKSLMTTAIQGHPDRLDISAITIDDLDEHGVDATAVGFAHYN
jgi:Holliday junction resolvasome RuvABC endonuclease subunit